MKVVFLARAGIHVTWLAGKLEENGVIDAVIFESGAPARRRKLKRHFATAPWNWPSRVLDLISLLRLGRESQRYLAQVLPSSVAPQKIPIYRCEDANEESVKTLLTELKPDLVLIYGTAILKTSTLKLAPLFLNIHGGLVPKYRNVHSEFWALTDGQPQEIGTSILYVTPGIDAGPIALQRAIDSSKVTSLESAQALNIHLAANLATEAIRAWKKGDLTRTPQLKGSYPHKPTPTSRDIRNLNSKLSRGLKKNNDA